MNAAGGAGVLSGLYLTSPVPSRKPSYAEYPSGDFQQHSWSSVNIHSSAKCLKQDRTGSPMHKMIYVIARGI